MSALTPKADYQISSQITQAIKLNAGRAVSRCAGTKIWTGQNADKQIILKRDQYEVLPGPEQTMLRQSRLQQSR
jgi:hypothetical protein